MITIEDIKRYADMQNELEKICYSYFEKHSNDFENYDGFKLDESGNIVIHYWFINYLDEHDSGILEVSYEKLIEFAINNI